MREEELLETWRERRNEIEDDINYENMYLHCLSNSLSAYQPSSPSIKLGEKYIRINGRLCLNKGFMGGYHFLLCMFIFSKICSKSVN